MKKTSNTRALGFAYEQAALKLLTTTIAQPMQLVEKNFSCRFGEIDLIMRQNKTIVFVEVKQRTHTYAGGAIHSLSKTKQQRLLASASIYMQNHPHRGPIRFDFVAFEGQKPVWITDVMQGDNLCLTI